MPSVSVKTPLLETEIVLPFGSVNDPAPVCEFTAGGCRTCPPTEVTLLVVFPVALSVQPEPSVVVAVKDVLEVGQDVLCETLTFVLPLNAWGVPKVS